MSTLDFYKVEVDLDRDNSYSHPASDLTHLVQVEGTQWESGILDRGARVGRPTRMTLNVSNQDGYFYTHDDEQLANADFDAWSGDNPVDWITTNENPGNTISKETILELPSGQYNTARFRSTGSSAAILQNGVLEPGREYVVQVVVESYVEGTLLVWDAGQGPFAEISANGVYTIYFTAVGETFVLTTPFGAGVNADLQVKSVSLKPRYPYGAITRGMNMRVQMRGHDGESFATVWQGKVKTIRKDWWTYSLNPQVQLVVEDQRTSLDQQNVKLPLRQNLRTDEALLAILNEVPTPWPYQNKYAFWDEISFWYDPYSFQEERYYYFDAVDYCAFDEGVYTIPWLPDVQATERGLSPMALIEQIVEAEMGRFFWDGTQGKFVFHNRQHDYAKSPAYAFEPDELNDVVLTASDELINLQEVQYYPRRIGPSHTTLYEATNLPIRLSSGERRIIAKYGDPNEPDTRVFAAGPVVVSYRVTDSQEAGGQDAGTLVSMAISEEAARAEITFTNPIGSELYLHELSVTGKPLYVSPPETVEAYNAESANQYERQTGALLSLELVTDGLVAQDRANYIVKHKGDPIQRVREFVVHLTDETDAFNSDMLALKVGDVVRLTNPAADHDRRYVIKGMRHLPLPDKHRITFLVDDHDGFKPILFDGSTKFDGQSYFAP